MRNGRRWTRLVLLVWLLRPASGQAQSGSRARDSLAIIAASRALSAAYVRNDTMALGLIYADSSLALPPNRVLRGRAAIRHSFAWGPRYRQLAHAMVPERLTLMGDVAIDFGTWTSTSQRGDAAPATASERYLVTWIRDGDGAWRILYDMWHRPGQ
jgi:ketosteroid isomerase-like protein